VDGGKAPDEPLPPVDGAAEPTGDVVGRLPGRLIVFLFQKDFHPSRCPSDADAAEGRSSSTPWG
jgi:hypothetical protein